MYISVTKILVMLGNIIFVSIPEEAFLYMFCVILLKQHKLIKFDKDNRKECLHKMAIPVVSMAIVSNILRLFHVNIAIVLFGSTILFTTLTIFVLEAKNWIEAVKIILAMMTSMTVFQLIELSYIPLVLNATGHTVEYFNGNELLNFALCFPERIVEYSLIVVLLLKRHSAIKSGDIFKAILDSLVLTVVTCILLVFDMTILFLTGYFLVFNRVLVVLPFSSQVMVIVLSLAFPIINLTGLWVFTYKMESRRIYNNQVKMAQIVELSRKAKSLVRNMKYTESVELMNNLIKIAKEVSES